MQVDFFHMRRVKSVALASVFIAGFAQAEPMHGIAMYGTPALPADFPHLPYADPDAPKGGKLIVGEVGSFDSLNPHILKGTTPWMLRFIGYESLMGRNWDEPFTLYCLLCESVETDADRTMVEFTLRPEARFSDGSPVTVEDVMWSYETLSTEGHPRYLGAWAAVESMEQTGPRSIRFTFNVENRELALIIGLRPILKKAQWEGKDFAQSGLDEAPISTAPYMVGAVEPGRSLSMVRNPDYWGKDLPFNRGLANFDEIRMEFFSDATALFEAFKAGVMNSNREFNAEKWETQYDFPAITSGDVVKSVIPHGRPSGIRGFVMNTRNPLFADWRVREAMIDVFNFEYINDTVTGRRQPRITSYFSNSELAMRPGPATGRVRELLEPFADDLLPGALEGYALPEGDGTERNRKNLRKALALFEEAGWTVQDGVMKDAQGRPFTFDILLNQGSDEEESMINLYVQALSRIGVTPTVTVVDSAQYTERTRGYRFDMTSYWRGLSLSPGTEQRLYWGSEGVDTPGTYNWMGMKSPAAEAMIDKILAARSNEEFLAATHALDRILTTGRYVIPVYQYPVSLIAHAKELHFPDHLPVYGDWLDWQAQTWWWGDK
ncbi:extracellular solute-binding protein [Salipiger sp.]|uniref:extracellular solute-binding protein n=1 Tax=Salipiger sp. TaxID=2078585 RepID=UPI003A96E2E3